MVVAITREQALAWPTRRQLLSRRGALSVMVSGRPPRKAIAGQVSKLSSILGRDRQAAVHVA